MNGTPRLLRGLRVICKETARATIAGLVKMRCKHYDALLGDLGHLAFFISSRREMLITLCVCDGRMNEGCYDIVIRRGLSEIGRAHV